MVELFCLKFNHQMHFDRVILVIVVLISYLTNAEVCKKRTSCVCQTDSGVEVDLTRLNHVKFTDQPVNDKPDQPQYEFSYQPCGSFTEPPDAKTGCLDVTVCQKVKNSPTSIEYFNIGKQQTESFGGDPKAGTLWVAYTDLQNPVIRRSNVSIKCLRQNNPTLEVHGETAKSSSEYTFTLNTNLVCYSGGLTTGSILCILFFVGVVVYILGGVLYLRFVRGAKGKEQIPNYEFWMDFPLLIRDGVLFVVNGCKVDSTYEQI